MSIFITGDIHGIIDIDKVVDFFSWSDFDHQLKKGEDYLIILGDTAICWDDGEHDEEVRKVLQSLPVTTLFIDGNHENFDLLYSYPEDIWHGGRVHEIEPDIIHLMRGYVFDIGGRTFFAFGGAHSTDIAHRTEGISWWRNELPSYEEYELGIKTLEERNYTVDYILTHTAPTNVITEISPFPMELEEKELSDYLQQIADKTEFEGWYFGHFHDDFNLGGFHCLMNDIAEL